MKMQRTKFAMLALLAALTVMNSCKKEETPDDAFMISFSVNGVNGTINESAKTITVELAPGINLSALAPTITVSEGATVSPASGETKDFSAGPVAYTVTDRSGTVVSTYQVTITSAVIKKMAFIGVAAQNTPAAWDALKGTDYDLKDDQTAAEWFMTHMASSTVQVAYHSIEDVAGGAVSLNQYDAVWIQFDGGWWGGEVAQFPNNLNWCLLKESAPIASGACDQLATNFVNVVKAYYNAGGNLMLGNFAGSIVDELGVVSAPEFAPNNAFGGVGVDDGATSGAWGVRWSGDVTSPLFNNIVTSTDAGCAAPFFILLESGTLKKNRSNQYNLNFGPWAPNGDTDPLATRRTSFLNMTGAKILMENCGENEPLMLEWSATGSKGTVITILAGTYDWYVGGVPNNNNIPTLTSNTLNYLANR